MKSNMYDPKLKNDGFIISFAKDNTIYPVVINEDQLEKLNILLSGVFAEGLTLINEPMGTPEGFALYKKKEND